MDFKTMNPLGIIGLIGAIILIVGVFVGWLSMTVGDTTFNWSGWDVYSNAKANGSLELDSHVGYKYVPLVALVCGVISLVLMILPTVMNTEKFAKVNNVLGIIALILAVVVVICGILFYIQSWTVDLGVLGSHTYKLTDVYSIKAGFWLVLVGGIITLVGGLMPIVKNVLMGKKTSKKTE